MGTKATLSWLCGQKTVTFYLQKAGHVRTWVRMNMMGLGEMVKPSFSLRKEC